MKLPACWRELTTPQETGTRCQQHRMEKSLVGTMRGLRARPNFSWEERHGEKRGKAGNTGAAETQQRCGEPGELCPLTP